MEIEQPEVPPTDTHRDRTVGVLGAGRMGLPIVGHLAKAGFEVRVHDPDASRESDVTGRGGIFCGEAQQVVQGARTVLVCVGYEAQVEELLVGRHALLAAAAPGTVFVVLSTVSPGVVQRLAEMAEGRGSFVIDGPICRGSTAADTGELLSLVGGPSEALEHVTPVLSAYSSDIAHLGPVGSGQVGKAVNNLMLWACLVTSHEGLALAQRFGVDVDTLRRALLISSATNGALSNWGNQTMAWAEDDMRIVEEMAMESGVALPQAAINREVCRALKPRRYQLERYGI